MDLDQQNENNALRQSIQELERKIEEKDQLLRQQESESRQQLDRETALRIQKEGELATHIQTKDEQDWKRWEMIENEKLEIRKAHAREMALQQEKHEALRTVQQLQVQHQQTTKELDHCQEREAREEKNRDKMVQEMNEMKLKICKAEGEIATLEKKNDSLQKEKDEGSRQLQSSSMLEFFVQCQTSLSSKLVSDPDPFQRNPKKATQMVNRFKPLKLHLFHGCEQEQRAIFDKLCNVFTPDLLVFTRLITVIENGERIESITSEKGLEMFLWAHVEGYAKQVFWELPSADKNSTVCEMYGKITVIHYARNLDESIGMTQTASPGEVSGATTTSIQAQDPVPGSADPKKKAKKDKVSQPDGMYVCIKPGKGRGRNILLFPIEVKPGYAVSRQLIALLKATDTFGEAKPGQPPQPGMNLLWGALMQIYDYMVRSLSSYGMLTTGEVIIFLYIDWSSDATTLYYHVAVPGEPADDTTGAPNDLKEAAFRSAVGQYVTFVLMTMRKCHDMNRKQREGVRAKLTKGDLLPTATITKANTGTQTVDEG
ncbi:hypothetical protein E4U32_004719 [Claviceps aff. humidiphila group G2b]|nr:hypothetical protein E4U32_004719 [Claviceps aff. humidiphila group G2b]